MKDKRKEKPEANRLPHRKHLWLAWVVANTIAFFVALIPIGIHVIASSFLNIIGLLPIILIIYAFVDIIGGLAFCLAQYIVLKHWWRRPYVDYNEWLWMSFLAYLVGITMASLLTVWPYLLDHAELHPLWAVSFGAVLAGTVGVAQCLFLEKRVSHAGLWIYAGVAGGAVGGVIFKVYGSYHNIDPLVADFAAFTLPGLAYGMITGSALVWLLRQPKPEKLDLKPKNPPKKKEIPL